VYFFNDECELVDDDQYDIFTLATQVERRQPAIYRSGRIGKDSAAYSPYSPESSKSRNRKAGVFLNS
jgi:hypothetical protein